MWILCQVIATCLIVITQVVFREYGVCWKSWIIYTIICSGFVGWMMPYSYSKAPTFFQPYFLSIVILSIIGTLFSVLYFHDTLSIPNMFGLGIGLLTVVLLAI